MSNPAQSSTYSFLRSFEMARIPCSQNPQLQQDITNGLVKLNPDGKPVHGGFNFNGQCYFGMESRGDLGYFNPEGNKNTFGGRTVFYSDNIKGQGAGTATTSNAIRLANQNWG